MVREKPEDMIAHNRITDDTDSGEDLEVHGSGKLDMQPTGDFESHFTFSLKYKQGRKALAIFALLVTAAIAIATLTSYALVEILSQ